MGKLKIISRSGEAFSGRVEAGGLLGVELKKYKGKDTVILGIPRGGVIIAREIVRELDAPFDIVLSRKIGAPGNPEFALGAVSEDGKVFWNESVAMHSSLSKEYIEEEVAHQLLEIKRRLELFRKAREKTPLKGKTVIITDDGLATGSTMQAAIWVCRKEGLKKIIAAIPVSSEDTAKRIASDADETIVLRVPAFFAAVGQFYRQFDQVSDEEVVKALKEEA